MQTTKRKHKCKRPFQRGEGGEVVKNVTNANGFVVVEVVVAAAAAAPGTSFAVKRCCQNVRNASLHSKSRK